MSEDPPHYPNAKPFGNTNYESNPDKPDKRLIIFSPMLNVQRYITVREVLREFSKKSPVLVVAEFGCCNFNFFENYMIECDFLTTVHQIDKDEMRLRSALHVIDTEWRRKAHDKKGRQPLTVNIFNGNVAEKDDRVLNSDVMIAIELIEHLLPNELEKLPETVFGFMKPKLVLITTPNYEFNVLFENHDGRIFRDPDHKFEFTREQFKHWAHDIIRAYPHYKVDLYGIGEPPDGSPNVGCCSQLAVFQQLNPSEPRSTESHAAYKLLGSYDYFKFEDNRSRTMKIFDNAASICSQFGRDSRFCVVLPNEECDYHKTICTLPLDFILEKCDLCSDSADLLSALDDYPLRFPVKYVDDVPYVITFDQCDCNY